MALLHLKLSILFPSLFGRAKRGAHACWPARAGARLGGRGRACWLVAQARATGRGRVRACWLAGPRPCLALSSFHALKGSDVTSSFQGKGKCTAWAAWGIFDQLTNCLKSLANSPTIHEIHAALPTIERYIVIMYDRGISESHVNSARQVLFTKKRREIENIPQTQDALIQHLLRVSYQAGHVWSQSLVKQPFIPSPEEFGWTRETSSRSISWKPKWLTLPPAVDARHATIRCGCVKGCKGQCRCFKAELPYTKLCKCGGCFVLNEVLCQHAE